MLQRWPVWFFHFVKSLPPLPNQCLVCRSWPSTDVVCPDCLQRFAPAVFRCTGCALALPGLSPEQPRCGACLRKPPVWHSAHAWVDYGYPWSQLIPRWKFARQPALAAHLARWMRAHAAIAQRIAAADVLIPVPLSPIRMRERGYNQAALLARHLDATKCQLHSLQRVQHTTAQSSSTRAAAAQSAACFCRGRGAPCADHRSAHCAGGRCHDHWRHLARCHAGAAAGRCSTGRCAVRGAHTMSAGKSAKADNTPPCFISSS